jgi:tetratricopeptide (TPR) repeat protein
MFNEGEIYFHKRDYESAIRKFTLSLSKNPYHTKARHYRGLIHFQDKNYGAAHRDFTKIIQLGYDWPATFYYRGLCNVNMSKRDDALMDFKIAKSLDPDNPMITKALEEILKKQ